MRQWTWLLLLILGLLMVNAVVTGYVAYSLLGSEIACWPPESYLESLRRQLLEEAEGKGKQGGEGGGLK